MSKRFTALTVALVAVVAFLVGLIIAGALTPTPVVSSEPRVQPRGNELLRAAGLAATPALVNFADVAERINAAVVNIDATAKVMDGLIRDGVSGLIVCGTVGENTSLSRAEKVAVMEAAVMEAVPASAGSSPARPCTRRCGAPSAERGSPAIPRRMQRCDSGGAQHLNRAGAAVEQTKSPHRVVKRQGFRLGVA